MVVPFPVVIQVGLQHLLVSREDSEDGPRCFSGHNFWVPTKLSKGIWKMFRYMKKHSLTGWWLGTFGVFFHNIWNVILPIDHYFSRVYGKLTGA